MRWLIEKWVYERSREYVLVVKMLWYLLFEIWRDYELREWDDLDKE